MGNHDWKSQTAQMVDFEHSKNIAILQSYGTTVCHAPADEFYKLAKHCTARRELAFEGARIQVLDLQIEASLVRFLAHWIHHRNAGNAIEATMKRQQEREEGVLDEEWLAHLIRAINVFVAPFRFVPDIADSLIDRFLEFLEDGGLDHIDQIYQICKASSKDKILSSVFANVFIHRKKHFAQQVPTCGYDEAVQKHMNRWMADVLVNDGDWSRLHPRFLISDEDHTIDFCFHHKHGKEEACYFDKRNANYS